MIDVYDRLTEVKDFMGGLLQRLVSLLDVCVMRMPPELELRRKPRRSPVPGESWRLYNNGDPFPPKSLVTILDVRDGWVRYKIGSGNMWGDERMEISMFSEVYRQTDATAKREVSDE